MLPRHTLRRKRGAAYDGFFTGVWLTNPLTSVEARVRQGPTRWCAWLLETGADRGEADAPYKTLAEFVAAAKHNPGSSSIGWVDHDRDTSCGTSCRRRAARACGVHLAFPRRASRIAACSAVTSNMMVIEPAERASISAPATCACSRRVNKSGYPRFSRRTRLLTEAAFDVSPVPRCAGVVVPPGIPKEKHRLLERCSASSRSRLVAQVPRREPVRGRLPECGR